MCLAKKKPLTLKWRFYNPCSLIAIINLDIKKHSSITLGSKKKIKTEITNYPSGSKNENASTQNLWNTAEVILR